MNKLYKVCLRRSIFIVLIFSLIVTGCSKHQESTIVSWENLQITPRANDSLCTELHPEELDTGEGIKHDVTSGMAIGFFPKDLSKPRKIAYDTYWVNSNEPVTFNWIFWYPPGNESDLHLRLLILVDEHQLASIFPQPGTYNDLHLTGGDDIALQITIPPLTAGTHEITAIAIPLPSGSPNEYGIVDLVSNRITLMVDPVFTPFRKIDFFPLPAEGSIRKNDPSIAIDLTLKQNALDIWNWPDPWLQQTAKKATRFYALAGYDDVTNLDAPLLAELDASFFALLLFVDYQQVEVVSGQKALYAQVDKDTAYTRIPLEIPPLLTGRHHILVLRIDTPGIPICVLKGDPKGRILPNSIYGKLVGINVLP